MLIQFPGADPFVTSCADILWTRHAIFLPHERLLKLREHSLPFVCSRPDFSRLRTLPAQRSAEEHVKITLEPIGVDLLCNKKPIEQTHVSVNAVRVKSFSINPIYEHFILFTAK